MALKDLLPAAPTFADERPPGTTCAAYVRGDGKRCAHYAPQGACALERGAVCSEWRKANGKPANAQRTLPLLAGATTPERRARPMAAPTAEREVPDGGPLPGAAPPIHPADAPASELLPELTADDIASFKALGVEVQLHSKSYGDLWLVPAYTGQPRKEITPEHAATLVRLLSVFPGSHVVAFDKATTSIPSAPSAPKGAPHAHGNPSQPAPLVQPPLSVRDLPP